MNFRKYLCVAVFCLFAISGFSAEAIGQERQRVVRTGQSQPTQTNPTTTQPQVVRPTSSRPTTPPPTVNRQVLTNEIVVRSNQPPVSLVKKTADSKPLTPPNKTFNNAIIYSATSTSMMMNSIKTKIGIPYLYGSTGPNRYDCSGFVWSVFSDAGFDFERSSARTFWNDFEPATGDDRYKFGTLVFFNRLGHVGIVADENGFYHASSSKGITYSPFAGYWGKRIVGFRRVPLSYLKGFAQQAQKLI